jgi:putative endopeptidase
MGEAIGKAYVEQHFPPSSKAAMVTLVGNLRSALAGKLRTLAWMSPATRKAALAKLDAFTVKIGYPDKFKTMPGWTSTGPAARQRDRIGALALAGHAG